MVKLTYCGLFFNIVVSPAVHTLLPSVLQRLDSGGIEALILILGKINPQLQIWPHHRSDNASQPSFFFHVGVQKIVKWCQIRRIWRVINQFNATVTHSSHCNHRLVRKSIVLYSLRRFSKPFTKMSLVLLFKVLTYPVWVYLEKNNNNAI